MQKTLEQAVQKISKDFADAGVPYTTAILAAGEEVGENFVEMGGEYHKHGEAVIAKIQQKQELTAVETAIALNRRSAGLNDIVSGLTLYLIAGAPSTTLPKI